MLGSDISAILKAAVDAGFSLIPVGSDDRAQRATHRVLGRAERLSAFLARVLMERKEK